MITPSSYNAIEFFVCDALKEYVEESIQSRYPVVFKSELNPESTYPCIFIDDGNAVEEPEGTATYNVTAYIGIATRVSAPRTMHRDVVGEIFDLIFNDDIVNNLNAGRVAGLCIQRLNKPMRITNNDEVARYTTQTLVALCSMSG